jgi:hypothetical protein
MSLLLVSFVAATFLLAMLVLPEIASVMRLPSRFSALPRAGSAWFEITSETAVWYSTGLFAVPLRWVLVRDPQAEFKTQALLCTDLKAGPQKIVSWFVMCWQLEVTFQEVRRHLGFETQRQWSEMAIRRTTPALLGLFSMITLFAHRQMRQAVSIFRRAAW